MGWMAVEGLELWESAVIWLAGQGLAVERGVAVEMNRRGNGSGGGSVELEGSEVGVWTLSGGYNATSWPSTGPG